MFAEIIFPEFYKKSLMRKQLFLLAYLFIACAAHSQTTPSTDSAPSYSTIHAFTLYKAPDSTLFTKNDLHKGRQVLLVIFSPDCGHCQHIATEIIKNINHFSKVNILMVTWLPYSNMLSFYKTYNMADYPQITMAWDSKYFFPPYYHLQSFPKLIIYNKKGKYVKEFSGEIQIEDVWKAMGKK
jgi:thioredoxin-related protein